MACMGPSSDPKRAEELYQSFLNHLKINWHIFNYEVNPLMKKSREEVLAQLKEVCKEIEFQDACENF